MIIGPTSAASDSFGVNPAGMKNIVTMPQAMKAAMFGRIMLDRNEPNFCTATRAPPGRFVSGDVVVMRMPLSWSRRGCPRRGDLGRDGLGRLLGVGRSLSGQGRPGERLRVVGRVPREGGADICECRWRHRQA